MYFTDKGIEELAERRGEETVTLGWLAEQLRDFVDLNPEFEIPIERERPRCCTSSRPSQASTKSFRSGVGQWIR